MGNQFRFGKVLQTKCKYKTKNLTLTKKMKIKSESMHLRYDYALIKHILFPVVIEWSRILK